MIIELIQEKDEKFTKLDWTFLGVSPILGVFITRLALFLHVRMPETTVCQGMLIVFKFWTAHDLETLLEARHASVIIDCEEAAPDHQKAATS